MSNMRKITQADYRALSPARQSPRCECCSRAGIDRPGTPRPSRITQRPPTVHCDACYNDPSLRWEDCKHGVPS